MTMNSIKKLRKQCVRFIKEKKTKQINNLMDKVEAENNNK